MLPEYPKALGTARSAIRELFEYGKKRKQMIGEENVFDFSLGNPSVESPSVVNQTLIDLINNTESTKLHGYTSGNGDINVRTCIANYLNEIEYKIVFALPIYIPLIVLIFFIFFTLLFARSSMSKIAKTDPMAVISEVA